MGPEVYLNQNLELVYYHYNNLRNKCSKKFQPKAHACLKQQSFPVVKNIFIFNTS